MLPLQRIVCPTDFSDFSCQAIEKGAELARHFEAELCVLHVAPTLEHTPGLTPFQDFAGVNTGSTRRIWKTPPGKPLSTIWPISSRGTT